MATLVLAIWLVPIFLLLLGTTYAIYRLTTPIWIAEQLWPAVTIMKPLCGLDPGLRENLESFYKLDYPNYQMVFGVESPLALEIGLVKEVAAGYPDIPTTIASLGLSMANPKVASMYAMKSHTYWRRHVVSDSNIRVPANYLKDLVSSQQPGVGVVTSIVAAKGATNLAGHMEASRMNAFYARWMFLAHLFRSTFVLGKSMAYYSDELGPVDALQNHIAEDFAIGQHFRDRGFDVNLAACPVVQHIGDKTFREFWQRNLRWSIAQKHCAPLAFYLEPLHFPLVLTAFALFAICPGAALGTLLFWFFCDYVQTLALDEDGFHLGGWLLSELSAPFIWLHAVFTNVVYWRGHMIRVKRGGTCEVHNA